MAADLHLVSNAETTTPPSSAMTLNPLPSEIEKVKHLIEQTLDDGKALDVIAINLQGKSALNDYMIIASGTSSRHVSALSDQLQQAFRDNGLKGISVQGAQQSDWVLMDTGDIVVHLFRPEVRSFYNLEKIWSVSPTDPKIIAS